MLEENFEYQAKQIFKSLKTDYEEEQKDRLTSNEDIMTFSDWLWENKELLGEAFYERLDEWCGIVEITQEFDFEEELPEPPAHGSEDAYKGDIWGSNSDKAC